jgi:hypothetical protein
MMFFFAFSTIEELRSVFKNAGRCDYEFDNLSFKGIHELLASVPLLRGEEGCVDVYMG